LFVTDRLSERLAQRNTDIFHRMVRINFYVPGRLNF
jgi:hypothetical protein|tara:strand:+ start:1446 stop:1553 length:108 start_codon:yes stop_codon:yes gene_type:complete